MANLCFTTMYIKGNPDEIKNLHDNISAAISEERVKNDYGKTWIGNLVVYMGYDWNEINCRGTIEYLGLSDDNTRLNIETCTAWSPCMDIFYKTMEKYAPSCELYLIGDVSEDGWFFTNDPEMEDRYYLEVFGNDLPPYFYNMEGVISGKELRENLIKVFGFYNDWDIEKILEYAEENLEDYIHVHKFEFSEGKWEDD